MAASYAVLSVMDFVGFPSGFGEEGLQRVKEYKFYF